jgi:hypothetical protein
MTTQIRTITIQNTDDLDRAKLLDDPQGIIFDSEDPDQFVKSKYMFKYGRLACISKYGKSTKRVYESLGLNYPGDPIPNPDLPD